MSNNRERCVMAGRCSGVPLTQRGEPVESLAIYWRNEKARRCEDCGYVFFSPPPDAELTDFYTRVYGPHNAGWYNIDIDYAPAKTHVRAGRVLSLAERLGFGREARFHEIGCSFGGTVHEIADRGYIVSGTDINPDAIDARRARGNTHIHAAREADYLTGKNVDVLYSFHMIEHVPGVIDMLRDLKACVGGILALWVPNILLPASLSKTFTDNSWFCFPEHLHMFSPASLLCVAEAAGYEVLHAETHIGYGLANEQMQQIIPSGPAPIDDAVRAHLLNASLMGEELEFVLVPKGSDVARRFDHLVTFQEERLSRFRAAEQKLMSLL